MDLEDFVGPGLETLEPRQAIPLLGRSQTRVYTWLREGHLVAKKFGRSWLIPVLRDEDGNPVFLFRGEGTKDNA
jgi:hypothetical protein